MTTSFNKPILLTLASVLGRTQYWGAGLVTAGVLAVMFTPFGGQVDSPGLGGGIQGPALPGGVGGTAVTSASLSTEEKQESGSENSHDLSELTATGEMKGLSVPTEDSLKNNVGWGLDNLVVLTGVGGRICKCLVGFQYTY